MLISAAPSSRAGCGLAVALDLAPGVQVRWSGATDAVLSCRAGEVTLSNLTAALAAAVAGLQHESDATGRSEQILDADGVSGLARWVGIRGCLEDIGALRYSLRWNSHLLARFTPGRRSPGVDAELPPGPVRLSRFAYLRRGEDGLVLESPLGIGPVELRDVRVLTHLEALWRRPVEREPPAEDGGDDWAGPLAGFLLSAGLAVSCDEDGASAEDQDPAARSWEFADLVLHARSRSVRADQAIGATYRWRGVLEPLPAVPPPLPYRRIPLPVPDRSLIAASDPPLAAVMEQRRSVRRHGEVPLRLGQLAEFLDRVARVRQPDSGPGPQGPLEIMPRITPGAGSCHPLELYPVVGRCEGLDTGVYHYDSLGHALEEMDGGPDAAVALLDSCGWMMEQADRPQVLLCITARFRRMSWKYEGVAYATMLKDVGVLYEAMYLAATAMGLAPCALGGGDTALITRALALAPLEEGPVGEFVLGSLPNPRS